MAVTPQLPREFYIPTGVPARTGTRWHVGPSDTLVSQGYTHTGLSGTGLGTALQTAITASSPGDWVVVTSVHPDTGARLFYDATGLTLKVHEPRTSIMSVLIGDAAESGTLVPFGIRVDPIDINLLPTLRTTQVNTPALSTGFNADYTIGGHYWYICGLHLTNADVVVNCPMLMVGGTARYAWLGAHVADHVVVDRVWAEGRGGSFKCARPITVLGHHIAVVNCYSRGGATTSGDAQGIHIVKGIGRANFAGDVLGDPSPVHIENNFTEAEHESMNVGGDVYNLDDLTKPEITDVTIRGNFITKDLRRHPCVGTTYWSGYGMTYDSTLGSQCKNLMEFKQGNRILVEGNHFRHAWRPADNQNYMMVMNTSGARSTSYDPATNVTTHTPPNAWIQYCGIRDITVRYNVFEGMKGWFQFAGCAYSNSALSDRDAPDDGVSTRWRLHDNLILDMRYEPWNRATANSGGYLCSSLATGTTHIGALIGWNCSALAPDGGGWHGGPDDLVMDHNTFFQTGTTPAETYWGWWMLPADGNIQNFPPRGFEFTNNILHCGNRGAYWQGAPWDPPVRQGAAALDRIFTTGGYTVRGNVFIQYGGVANSPPNGMRAGTCVRTNGNQQMNGNFFIKQWSQLGLVSPPADGDLMYYVGDLRLDLGNTNPLATPDVDLNSNVRVLGLATDGGNPGADIDTIEAVSAGVGEYDIALNLISRGFMVGVWGSGGGANTGTPPSNAAVLTGAAGRMNLGIVTQTP
jgi:hypothetical protein